MQHHLQVRVCVNDCKGLSTQDSDRADVVMEGWTSLKLIADIRKKQSSIY